MLTTPFRRLVGLALKAKFDERQALAIAIAVSGQHAHVLVKASKSCIEGWIADAKRHAWFELREQGWTSRLWGGGKKCLRVRGRAHQLNVYGYILRYKAERAWVWCLARGEL